MGNKFYFIVLCLLSCSMLLLGMSYSKDSLNDVEDSIIDSENNRFRVVYDRLGNLDTKDNNELEFNIINKRSIRVNYALYLKEVDNETYEDIYYSINDSEYQLLTDGVIDLGYLSKFGYDGDSKQYKITLKSDSEYSFYYSVGEYSCIDCEILDGTSNAVILNGDGSLSFLDEVSYGS